MKKILVTIAALALTAAQATEIGPVIGHAYSGAGYTTYGVAMTEDFGNASITAAIERADSNAVELNRYSVVANYHVAKLGSSTVNLKTGFAFNDGLHAASGVAGVLGAGVDIPLTDKFSAEVAVVRQFTQDRVAQPNSNNATVSVKYKF